MAALDRVSTKPRWRGGADRVLPWRQDYDMGQDEDVVTLDEVLRLARRLSPLEKRRLIQGIAPEIERDLTLRRTSRRTSLLGLVKDLGPAPPAEAIDSARCDAWASFPRDAQ